MWGNNSCVVLCRCVGTPAGGFGLGGGSDPVLVLRRSSLCRRYSLSVTVLDPSSRAIRLLLVGEGDLVDLGVPSDEVAAGDFDLDVFDLAPP